jgi:hypothetical protein
MNYQQKINMMENTSRGAFILSVSPASFLEARFKSSWRQANQTVVFHGFPQSLQENAGIGQDNFLLNPFQLTIR